MRKRPPRPRYNGLHDHAGKVAQKASQPPPTVATTAQGAESSSIRRKAKEPASVSDKPLSSHAKMRGEKGARGKAGVSVAALSDRIASLRKHSPFVQTKSSNEKEKSEKDIRIRVPQTPTHPVAAENATAVFGSQENLGISGFSARLAEKQAVRRRLLTRRLTIIATLVIVLSFFGWLVFFSPVFALSRDGIEVHVSGNEISDTEIQDAVSPFVGTPLIRLKTNEVADEISRIPLAGSVRVSRSFPSGILVHVGVRKTVLFELIGDTTHPVDSDGHVMPEGSIAPDGLATAVIPGENRVQERRIAIQGVRDLWQALSVGMKEQVQHIDASGAQIVLTLTDNRTVRWGTGADAELKARVLEVLTSQRPAQIYDVSTPTKPITA